MVGFGALVHQWWRRRCWCNGSLPSPTHVPRQNSSGWHWHWSEHHGGYFVGPRQCLMPKWWDLVQYWQKGQDCRVVLVQRPPVRHQVLTCLSRSCRWHWPLLASRGVSWSQASHTINQSPVDSPVTGESEPNLLKTVFAVKGLAVIQSFGGNSADSLSVKMNGWLNWPTHGEIYLNPELCLKRFQ